MYQNSEKLKETYKTGIIVAAVARNWSWVSVSECSPALTAVT
jgi:hypothetical protein